MSSTDPRQRLRILLVEDNRDIAANVIDNAERVGHAMDYAISGESALQLLAENQYDILVIDIMLPGSNGIDLCATVREQRLSTAPILMLTARADIDDKVAAFDAGADDYLVKPFAMRELLARCQVLARRGSPVEMSALSLLGIELQVSTRSVTRNAQPIQLTPIGFQILLTLMRASPAVVLRDDLEQAVWGEERPDSDALRTHLSVLRSAIDKPFEHALIQTVHGAGWKLTEESESS